MLYKNVRKLMALLLVIGLMSSTLGIGSVSVSADSASCDAVVTKRGLCITGWHNDTDDSIKDGPKKYEPRFYHNVDRMIEVFKNLGVSKPVNFKNVKSKENPYPDVNAVFGAIEKAFKDADSNDINYLYLTGHGAKYEGYMNVGGKETLGTEDERLYYSELKEKLDELKNHGHFIIFIQSCYSGQAINRSSKTTATEDSETLSESEMILEYFFADDSDEIVFDGESDFVGTSGNNTYTVFCSSTKEQTSIAWKDGYGWATYAWAEGLGWRINSTGTGGKSCDRLADKNGDDIVTVSELNAYAKKKVQALVDEWNKNHDTKIKENTPCYYSRYYFRTVGSKDYPLGDSGKDGDITSKDLLLMRKFIANNKSPDDRQKKLSDVNGDKVITNKDVLCLQYYLAGLSLPKTQ